MSEAGTRFLLRQPQLSVSAPLVLVPYVVIRQDPSNHIDTHTHTRKSGRQDLCGKQGLYAPISSPPETAVLEGQK